MIGKLKQAARYFFGTGGPAERFTVFPDDAFLVTYSRSSDAWACFLLASWLAPKSRD